MRFQDDSIQYVLVTGANSGLGLATCYRLIADFLDTRPHTHALTLIFTTRDDKKSSATLRALERHLFYCRLIRPGLPVSKPLVIFRPETLELTSLLSVRSLSQRLLRSAVPRLDAILLNAGVGGFVGLNWPLAIWSVTTDLVQATTWPTYKLSAAGLITHPQLPPSATHLQNDEPALGEVFCANLFGHYMLAHWLMPLLRSCPESKPGRMIWLSSIEGQSHHFNRDDIRAVESDDPYAHTKRMTDLMALTSRNQSATGKSVTTFLDCPMHDKRLTKNPAPSKPTIHVVHPGICATSIVPLPWILRMLMIVAFYMARLIGSPWHTASAYIGARAPVWLALADPDEIAERESPGAAKWGSAVTRWGKESVQRTDVPGWGLAGDGKKVEWWQDGIGWLGGWGRKRGARDATREDVEKFVEEGSLVWRELERLRREWEERIEKLENSEREREY